MSLFRAGAAPAEDPAPPAPVATLPKPSELLGELLVRSDRISQGQLSEALLQQSASGKRIGTLLVELGVLDDLDLAEALAKQFELELADLRRNTPDPEAVALLAETSARRFTAIPLRLDEESLVVAVADVSSETLNDLTVAAGRTVTLAVAAASDLRRAIDTSYRALADIDQHVRAFEATTAESLRRAAEAVRPDSGTDDAPVVQVVNLIITQGLRDRASDIHIEPQGDRVRVRLRIDGALHDVLALPGEIGPALVSRVKIMASMNIVERRRPQDGQIATEIDGRALDIRVSTTATIQGEKVVMRLLDKSKPLFRAAELGMPDDTHEAFSAMVRSPYGMVICAGPTGSGKTTTLYATLAELNATERNIMTIEDPVEYVFPSINQIQINEQAGLSFAGGLKSILRQDPDVILVGEIRDVDTARIAVQSALTGHFVLSSIHATDSVLALHRFLDMGIESFLIASSVRAVVGQRLVRRICTTCKEPYTLSGEEKDFYVELSEGGTKRKFYRGVGCNFCAGTGYRDRVGVYELLRVTPELKRLIVGWASQDELRRMAIQQGMRTLKDEAMALVEHNVTTIHEVVKTIYAA
ncbi:MAG TPA: GspE/PulE family protein [Acidimicrobiales bacterium]|nr:GspE/PulE family protein [Acidimicrobiales bacterium]